MRRALPGYFPRSSKGEFQMATHEGRAGACVEGGCLCGRVRFRVAAEPLDSGYCHCRMCQRNSGAPVVAWVTFPAAGFSWIAAEPGTYQSSAHAKRQFCPACGSYLVFRNDDLPNEVSINTAALDEPA